MISTSLNVIGLMFLIKETPPNQASIRKYLIIIQVFLLFPTSNIRIVRIGYLIVNYTQVFLMLSDIHLEIGFHPIPLFPAYAGYAVGVLIQLGISTHIEWVIILNFHISIIILFQAITICFYIWIGASILMCISFRHQNIVSTGDAFKFKRVAYFTNIIFPSLNYVFRQLSICFGFF